MSWTDWVGGGLYIVLVAKARSTVKNAWIARRLCMWARRLQWGKVEMCEVRNVNDLVYGAYVLNRSGRRWAVNWCDCKMKRHGVGCGQNEMSKQLRLLVAAGEGGAMWSDWSAWCCLSCVHCEQVGSWWAACRCSMSDVTQIARRRGDVELGEEDVSICTSLLLSMERDGEMQSGWLVWCCLCCVHHEHVGSRGALWDYGWLRHCRRICTVCRGRATYG